MAFSATRKLAFAALVFTSLYLAGGFLLAPYLAVHRTQQFAAQLAGAELQLGRVRVNPFTWVFELTAIVIDAPDGTHLLDIGLARANLDFADLLRRGVSIRELELSDAVIAVRSGGGDGLARVLGMLRGDAGAPELPRVRIGRASIERGAVRTLEAEGQWRPLTFEQISGELSGLDTRSVRLTRYSFDTTTPGGGRLMLAGDGSLLASSTRGGFTLHALDLDALRDWRQAPPYPMAGVLSAQGEFSLSDRNGASSLELQDTQATISELRWQPPYRATVAGRSIGLTLAAAAIEAQDINAGLWPRQLSVGTLRAQAPRLQLFVEAPEQASASNAGDAPGHAAGGRIAPARDRWLVRRLEIDDGLLDLVDQGVFPALALEVERLSGTLTGFGNDPDDLTTVTLSGALPERGAIDIAARVSLADLRARSEIELKLRNVEGSLLSPYAAGVLGREISGGRIGGDLRYEIASQRLIARHRLVLDDLALGAAREDAHHQALPLDLVVAVLQDAGGRIVIDLPVSGRLDAPGFTVSDALAGRIAALATDIANAPFGLLGELAGAPGVALDTVAFAPGSAELTPEAAMQLRALASGLAQRPRLGLIATGGYADADFDALARRQIRQHVALATSTTPAQLSNPPPPAFGDPKIQSVLDEFAGERLQAERLAAIGARFPAPSTGEPTAQSAAERAPYYEAVFEALAANERVSGLALKSLARFRAQSVVAELTRLGITAERLQITPQAEAVEVTEDGRVVVALALEADPLPLALPLPLPLP